MNVSLVCFVCNVAYNKLKTRYAIKTNNIIVRKYEDRKDNNTLIGRNKTSNDGKK